MPHDAVSAERDWLACPRLPVPRFDAEALENHLNLVGDPKFVIRGGLKMIAPPVWNAGREAIASLFDLANPAHCFHSAPHTWARFHEPQVTAGFAHFLNSGTGRRRLSRATAFVKAACLSVGQDAGFLDAFDAQSMYCAAEENRTDILIELRSGQRRIGASIEAKFGHKLTGDQLPKALAFVNKREWMLDNSVLLVVSPDTASLDPKIMKANKGKGWQSASWWTLLSQLEQMTDPDDDCEDYRRFRRTVWLRAY